MMSIACNSAHFSNAAKPTQVYLVCNKPQGTDAKSGSESMTFLWSAICMITSCARCIS